MAHGRGQLTVVHTDEVGSLTVGDVVTKVGGLPSGEVLEREIALLSQTGDLAQRYAENIVLSGAENSPLELEVASANGEVRPIAVRRSVDRRGRKGVPTDNRPASPVARLGDGVVYFDFTRLDDTTDVYTGEAAIHDLAALVTLLAGAEGLVFDMRGYPGWTLPIELFGHLTDKPLRTAPLYMPVVTRPDTPVALVDVTYE